MAVSLNLNNRTMVKEDSTVRPLVSGVIHEAPTSKVETVGGFPFRKEMVHEQ